MRDWEGSRVVNRHQAWVRARWKVQSSGRTMSCGALGGRERRAADGVRGGDRRVSVEVGRLGGSRRPRFCLRLRGWGIEGLAGLVLEHRAPGDTAPGTRHSAGSCVSVGGSKFLGAVSPGFLENQLKPRGQAGPLCPSGIWRNFTPTLNLQAQCLQRTLLPRHPNLPPPK